MGPTFTYGSWATFPSPQLTNNTFQELEEYLQQQCACRTRDAEPHRSLLSLVQSISALSSGGDLKNYIRTKRQEIVQRQRSMSQSLSSDASGEDRAIPEGAQLAAATIPEAQQRAVKRARVDADYLICTQSPPLNAVVLMGVAGSGKTNVGTSAAARAGWQYVDGDNMHSPENKEKMARGEALTDQDRWGWLQSIRKEVVSSVQTNQHKVISCSALKRKYRDYLLDQNIVEPGRAVAVYLRVSEATSMRRVEQRQGHFAGTALVPTQFATLEEPEADEAVVEVDAEQDVQNVVGNVVAMLQGSCC